jgi:DNA-binding MarR family transcriptional regulator
MHEWNRYVKSTELSMPQFYMLMRLYHKGGCGISDISSYLDVSAAAASQLVDRLVREGFLERAEDPHDRRAKQVTLSPKGRALIEKGIEVRNRWLEKLIPRLTAEQRQTVAVALGHLTEATRAIDRDV